MHPKPNTFSLSDIARGLSGECRYGGQTSEHYSVAEHSFRLRLVMNTTFAKVYAGLHDGHEFVFKDVPRPIKLLLASSGVYDQKCNLLQYVINKKYLDLRFGVGWDEKYKEEIEWVHKMDSIMPVMEAPIVMGTATLPKINSESDPQHQKMVSLLTMASDEYDGLRLGWSREKAFTIYTREMSAHGIQLYS